MRKQYLLIFALLFSLTSCKYDLISEPSKDSASLGISGIDVSITPPQSLSASQGDYRSITLTWEASKNAVQYQIFSAATPFESFTQIGETKGNETKFTLNETFGTTTYYMIKAVNSKGLVSKGSDITYGNTLDVPIITSITPKAEGDAVTVNWWMSNCTPETYSKEVQFKVVVYDHNKSKLPEDKYTVKINPNADSNKAPTSALVTGLASKTDYFFVIEASNGKTGQKSEKSDYTSVETAHKIIPDKGSDFTASKGNNDTSVTLTWKLPEPIDYRDKQTLLFTSKSIYFTLERKLKDADDSTYAIIQSYIGTDAAKTGLHFDCETGTADSGISVTIPAAGTGTNPKDNTKYKSLTEVTYVDSDASLERGKQYSYRLRSYTDGVAEKITSDETTNNSVTTNEGWLIAQAKFYARGILNKNETDQTKIDSVEVDYSLSFEDFGIAYTYAVTYTKNGNEVLYRKFNSVNEVLNEKQIFDNPVDPNQKGSYKYSLYIIEGTGIPIAAVPASYILKADSLGQILVTELLSDLPEITTFTIDEGYSNKFVLSWNKITNASYTLEWKSFIDGVETENSEIIADNSFTGTLNHTAVSGETRTYTLTAEKNDITFTKVFEETYTYEEDGETKTAQRPKEVKTLGTPKPELKEIDYKSITVSWPAVQMADENYEIIANYNYTKNAILHNESIIVPSTAITHNEDNSTYTCTITEPSGFDNFDISGQPIELKVKATSSVHNTENTTNSPVTVRTLGPALVNTRTDSVNTEETKLSVSWNKITGAKGYLIYRTKYNYKEDFSAWTFAKADTYFYNATEEKLYAGSNAIDSNYATVTLKNDVYTLVDYNKDLANASGTSGYDENQSQIIWGIPFGYTVLPVKGKNDFSFDVENDTIKITGGSANLTYNNVALPVSKTATTGYGLNISAEKASSKSIQVITWKLPAQGALKNAANENLLKATLYRRLAGTNNTWKRVTSTMTVTGNTVTCSYTPAGEDSDTSKTNLFKFNQQQYLPYEYAVKYSIATGASSTNFSNSYINKLAEDIEDSSNYDYTNQKSEQRNKGYLLNIPVYADFGGTINNGYAAHDIYRYSEKLELEPWDYDTRSIGPDSYEVSVFCSDLASNQWYSVSTYNKEQNITSVETITDTLIISDAKITRLWPAGIKNGTSNTSNGPLRVIRDAKHYYKVKMKRSGYTDAANDDSITIGDDYSISAYRDLTDEELCKAAMYIFAYGFYINDGGQANFNNINKQFTYGGESTVPGASGNAVFSARSRATGELGIGKFKQYYTYNNYRPEIHTPSGQTINSFISFNSSQHSCGIKGDSDNYIYMFRDTPTFTIKSADPSIILKYDCSINFSCPNNNTLTLKITRNGTTTTPVNTTDNATRKAWFPMQIHGDTSYLFNSSDWWN